MFSVLIGIIVGTIAKTWMQLAGATVIVVAVLTLVINFAYNMWLLSEAGIPLTVSLRDWVFGFCHQSAAGPHRCGSDVRLAAEVGAQTAHYLRQIATKRPTG